eukprot:7388498-Pyramimonas_sp.AAC.1
MAWQAWHLLDTMGGAHGVVPHRGLYPSQGRNNAWQAWQFRDTIEGAQGVVPHRGLHPLQGRKARVAWYCLCLDTIEGAQGGVPHRGRRGTFSTP